jgi:multidrug efflux system outer membrane protein
MGDGKPHTYTSSVVGGSLSWEVDLWGRVRNIASAGRAEAEASAGDLASVRLSLQAALADAYFRLRGLDQQALLLEETVEAYSRAHDLTVTRHDGGIGSGIDVNRSQTLLSNARAQLADVRLQRAQTEHEIAALVGELASAFAIAPSVRPLAPPAVAPLVPAQLLERRPDVAAAERRMAAANARIGAARAAFFPTVSIDAAGGYQTAGGKLFDSPASYWALGPLAAVLPLFDGGRRKAAVDVARADHAGTAASYRETVLAAFREVEDALVAVRTLGDRWSDQRNAAAAADRTRLLALVRYRDGASDYLEVVTAQTASLDASRQVLSIETERMRAAIALIRATGGGLPPQPAAG